jgi:hypothetical protein
MLSQLIQCRAMTAPTTKPVLDDQCCCETGGNREKNFLIHTQFAILYYSIIEKIRRGGGLNISGTVSGNEYI